MMKFRYSEEFLPKAHCPTADISLCAVGEAYPKIQEALNKLGINIFSILSNEKLSKPVQSHADLQLGLLGNDTLLVGKGERDLENRLRALEFTVYESTQKLSNQYPQEAQLDFLVINDIFIGNSKIIDKEYLLKYSQINHVKQSYSKCNIAVVNDRALITADPIIAKSCRILGFDVLQIRPGYIELAPYDTGFIGGCCGLIAADCLAVSGDLSTHPDHKEILTFLRKHHVSVHTLIDGPLQDIGGIIPLKQRR